MQRLIELILGLQKGFLSKQGEFTLSFNPSWPGQQVLGAAFWNLILSAAALALVIWVYRREGRSRNARITLGVIRGLLLALVIALLNRPVLTLGQSRTEPSVLAVLVDGSISMRVRDAVLNDPAKPEARLEAAVNLLTENDQKLMRELGKTHQLRFYRFDSTATPIAASPTSRPSTAPADFAALKELKPDGQ